MKALNRTRNEWRSTSVVAPVVDAAVVAALAGQVEQGQAVAAGLNDGMFVALMAELRRRGWAPEERSEAEKHLKPFVVRVGRRQ